MKKIDEGTKFRKSKSNRLAVTFDSISIIEIESNYRLSKHHYRCEQDLNLRGKNPLDFKSNALTTRPSQLTHTDGEQRAAL
jgi:hypothetical protein